MSPRPRHLRPRCPGRLAALALAALAACAGPTAGSRARTLPPSPAAAARLAGWVDPVEAIDPGAFVPLDGPGALGSVAPDLSAWWRRFFRPEASPARAEGARLGALPGATGAPDLVRSEYDMAVVRVEVLDTAAFTLVRIADPGVDVADGAAAQVLVRRLLAVGPDRAWDLSLPARLAEGTWYASAPEVDPGAMPSFRDRLDVRVLGGRLEILCAKRQGARSTPDGAAWFPADLRGRLAGGR
jgi:hypothetical protein